MVLGANDVATASQIITSLLIAGENATESIEAARFNVLLDGNIGLEGKTILFILILERKYLEVAPQLHQRLWFKL